MFLISFLEGCHRSDSTGQLSEIMGNQESGRNRQVWERESRMGVAMTEREICHSMRSLLLFTFEDVWANGESYTNFEKVG